MATLLRKEPMSRRIGQVLQASFHLLIQKTTIRRLMLRTSLRILNSNARLNDIV